MRCPTRLSAFTLVELLAVLVIVGLLLALGGGMSKRTRDTFISQQFVKTLVQNARILRRKSMLISRSSLEKEWVHGIGMRLENNNGSWSVKQIRALATPQLGNSLVFYRAFPANVSSLRDKSDPACTNAAGTPSQSILCYQQLDGTNALGLYGDLRLDIMPYIGGVAQSPCTTALTVLYESVNGNLHAYCKDSTTGLELPVGWTPSAPQPKDVSIKIIIAYSATSATPAATYNSYINLTDRGEIDALQN